MKPATVPPDAPTGDPTVYKARSDVSHVPVAWFAEQEFLPTQLCEYCQQTQEHDPGNQNRIAIGLVNGLRCCEFHVKLFEQEPELARLP